MFCSLRWSGTSSSSNFSFYSSELQKKAPIIKVSNLKEQVIIIRHQKTLGTKLSYPIPGDNKTYRLNVLLFSDVSKNYVVGKLGVNI